MKRNHTFNWIFGLTPVAELTRTGSNHWGQFDWPGLFATSNGDKETIRVKRRRRGDGASGERERADAPQRRRRDEPSRPSGSGGMGGSSRPPIFSGGKGGKLPPAVIGIIVVVLICGFIFTSFFGSDESGDFNQQEANNAQIDFPTATPVGVEPAVQRPTPTRFVPPASSSEEGQTWLIMLYQDADDQVLEQDIYLDLNEAERVGSSDRVHIVSQVDRYRAGYQGDGDWSSVKRFYITQDADLNRVVSQEVADLGEVNMSDGATLVDFVTWAAETYPADKHVLIMSDHGMGWPGGWSDPDPGRNAGSDDQNIPLVSALGDELYLMELDEALAQIRSNTGIDKFELIGMDACLMGHLEVFSALAPHARYAVASQETEPALGWAYTGFLGDLQANPDMSGADLSRLIVQSYIIEDQRIVDDQARAEFTRQGSPMGGLFGMLGGPSAEQLTQQLGQNVTLTAVDLEAIPALISSVNDLSFAMQDMNQRSIAQARNYAQSFTSVFGRNIPPSYIDLGHFAQLLQREGGSQAIAQPAANVLAAIEQAVIAEKHGPQKSGATGISIYFPNSQLYSSPVTGPQSYTAVARRFATDSLWDDFLAYHYTGRGFQQAATTAVIPDRSASIVAPGAGSIQVSPITASDNVVAPGQSILLSTDISGSNVGYVFLFVGFFDQASNSIFIADSDYLESADTRQIDGVYYPVWSEQNEFTMEFEWEPIVFAINDGADSVVAHFTPQTYGASFEDATYTVDGIYTYADGGETRYSRLYFNNGLLKQVFGFTGEGGTGAPREIIPQPGDTFTILEQWMDLDQQGNVTEVVQQNGDTLTFGDQTFTWEELDAAAGEYIVGFIVEDLDGNANEVYTRVTVQ